MPAEAKLLIQKVGDVTVVDFEDARILDTFQVEELGKQLYHLVDAQNRKKLILDFSKVQFLSSSALGILLDLHRRAKAIKGEVVLCGLRPEIKQIFDIMKLNKLFKLYPLEAEALRHFGVNA